MSRAVLMLFVLAACGSSSDDRTASGSAENRPAETKPAGSARARKYHALADRICACTNRDCIVAVTREIHELGPVFNGKETPTLEESKHVMDDNGRIIQCQSNPELAGPPLPPPPPPPPAPTTRDLDTRIRYVSDTLRGNHPVAFLGVSNARADGALAPNGVVDIVLGIEPGGEMPVVGGNGAVIPIRCPSFAWRDTVGAGKPGGCGAGHERLARPRCGVAEVIRRAKVIGAREIQLSLTTRGWQVIADGKPTEIRDDC